MPRIKELLAQGQVVRVFAIGQLLSPKLVEIVGEHGDFDALWLDFEHAGISMQQVELATLAAKAYGMDHFVRLPATDYASVMRPLEAGAGGVMISMVRSAGEAEQAVRWAKFWPRGERGLNGGNRDGRFGLTPLAEYMAAANASTFVGIQIETAGAARQRGGDRRNSRCRSPVRRPVRPQPGAGRSRRFREPQVPGGHRDDRTNLCRGQEALGRLHVTRPGLRGANARPGMPALRHRLRHPLGPRRNPLGQGAIHRGFSRLAESMRRAARRCSRIAVGTGRLMRGCRLPGPRRRSAASCRSWRVRR